VIFLIFILNLRTFIPLPHVWEKVDYGWQKNAITGISCKFFLVTQESSRASYVKRKKVIVNSDWK
jgi:hypothetical protein